MPSGRRAAEPSIGQGIDPVVVGTVPQACRHARFDIPVVVAAADLGETAGHACDTAKADETKEAPDEARYWSLEQVAKYLGVIVQKAYALARPGETPGDQDRGPGVWRADRTSLTTTSSALRPTHRSGRRSIR